MATSQPMIIGLYSPNPGSGKTTLASFIEEAFGFQRCSFAKPIKRTVDHFLLLNGLDWDVIGHLREEDKEAPIPEVNNKSYRELCQTLGNEWARAHIAPDIWVKMLFEQVEEGANLVIDDVRFEEEYQAIKERGGQVWSIIRPTTSIPKPAHLSEGRLDCHDFDRIFINDGTYHELYQQILKEI